MKIYAYSGCGTCKKAFKFLDARGIPYEKVAIRETPPTKTELKKMLKAMKGEIKKLFNISGQDYRKLNLKDVMATLMEKEAIDMLHSNGNLIKRPFVVSDKWMAVGFKEEDWALQF